jgi:DNA helicase-2/ATP-dependent DNA helicase PcrA
LQSCASSVPKKATVAWAQLVATVAQAEAPEIKNKPAQLIRHIVEAFYKEYAEDNFANYSARLDELEQLGQFAQGFQDTNEFLTQLALLSNLEAEDDKPRSEDDETMKLTTIHQAKGLEFTTVFVIMLCEGLFPSGRSLERDEALEEERRLFYVAITRAKRELYLSYPLIRMTQGYSSDFMQRRSQFLDELPPELLDEWSLRSGGPF